MSGTQPVAVYAMRIPPGDVMMPAVPNAAAMFRVTMAAIDPSEEPDLEAAEDKTKGRATLKLVRVPAEMLDDSEDDDDFEDIDDDEESDEEEGNGGPSDRKSKSKKLAKAEDEDDEDEDMDDDSADEAAAEALLAKIMKSEKKGKSKAVDGEVDDESDDTSDEGTGIDEVVLCTLDSEKIYQQPLDVHVAEGENVFFKVSGSLTVHLSGNYVMPLDEPEGDDDDDEYDLSPDEDELDGLDALVDGEESDELDDLEDPRIMEVDDEEEKPKAIAAPTKESKKGKNKRPAEDTEEEVSLDNIMAKEAAAAPEQPKKLSKAEKKAAKKLKNNEGEAAAAPEAKKEKESPQTNGTDADKKKVQFAKNLEQGPTPSKSDAKADTKADTKSADKPKSVSLGIKDVNGVSVDDRKIGSGPAAKKGSRVEMRYIGKLDNGKVFDSNKSGKPFAFKLGIGEVIKGWDHGLTGISAGGERRLVIPAGLAYGKKSLPGIPANSTLTFDDKDDVGSDAEKMDVDLDGEKSEEVVKHEPKEGSSSPEAIPITKVHQNSETRSKKKKSRKNRDKRRGDGSKKDESKDKKQDEAAKQDQSKSTDANSQPKSTFTGTKIKLEPFSDDSS
ncbi:peptidylprolyl isomerase fpr3 [Knufia obscura]|uniref:peptidylprolyl isomerase n=1 Tax=Knufia obscura TaxID=1635080 RepID=A0ABR0RZC0_9EURO|nr:peptidylprolyl isomerase fpr3 [Knufia obscura]